MEKKKTLKPCEVFTNKPQEEEEEEWNMVVPPSNFNYL